VRDLPYRIEDEFSRREKVGETARARREDQGHRDKDDGS
jgi:hypothetical protein